jgi:hypothetical protein
MQPREADGAQPRSGHLRESLVLFALTAWPAWIVSVPPLQDLPNHLASAWVQSHLAQYPAYVSNGFAKTNAALFLFLHVLAPVVSLRTAAKLFVTLTCAVGAFAYPRAVRALGGNVRSASLLLWPMVHGWFVAMGMLDYALAAALAVLALAALEWHRRAPSFGRGALVALLVVLVWYAHAFAVGMLALLVGLEAIARRSARDAWTLGAPLVPALALTAGSSVVQLASETTAGQASLYMGVPTLLYGAWAEWLWPATKWTLASLACAAGLGWYGLRRWRERPAFFSPLAMGVLVVLYLVLPYQAHRWYYVTARVLPFFWLGCALRVPSEMPRWAKGALAACALSFSAGLGVEYAKIAHDWDVFCRGESAVPRGARLLPLVFDRKGPHGDNTWPMLHAWGLYVIDRDTSAALVFAHSRSFPISYAKEPPRRFHGITLEQFPKTMRTAAGFCEELRKRGVVPDDCAAAYRAAWDEFWADARTRFDRVVMYGPSADVRAAVPPSFRVLYDRDETVVFATSPRGS